MSGTSSWPVFSTGLLKNTKEKCDMTMNKVEKIDDRISVNQVLISVSNKSGLETFAPRLLAINPDIRIISTGGTFARLRQILGKQADGCLTQVADYTGQPETQGGLVKTLDFKIYLGLLTETYNDAHRSDLKRTGAVPIDMVVVNLYPFKETIAKAGVTPEQARGNIDIGGPCMIRASAKNFIRVASVVNPGDYGEIIDEMAAGKGRIDLALRYRLARKAFAHTAAYDAAIAGYLAGTAFDTVQNGYLLQDG
jgi:phosphoribosylaminoimidazolecarboxamide formyltransferase / IMP cyclohydrolase